MKTLLLDSSNRMLSVGYAKDNVLIDSISYEAWQRQSEVMIPEIDRIMNRNNLSRKNLDEVVVSIGPGSYTGVRIALTIAKTIAVALSIKVYAISSLEAQKISKSPTICLINARSGRSYIGVYFNDKILLSDQVMENSRVLEYIKDHPKYAVSGDASYLGIEWIQTSVLNGMLISKNESKLVANPLALKPVYLKD
ncbi:MAG: tRNA (adenosine(37)-N6)-threonylcarbamoyltransferase complex dimerization subunit type 1 TsaB [Bacilli bacterium]